MQINLQERHLGRPRPRGSAILEFILKNNANYMESTKDKKSLEEP